MNSLLSMYTQEELADAHAHYEERFHYQPDAFKLVTPLDVDYALLSKDMGTDHDPTLCKELVKRNLHKNITINQMLESGCRSCSIRVTPERIVFRSMPYSSGRGCGNGALYSQVPDAVKLGGNYIINHAASLENYNALTLISVLPSNILKLTEIEGIEFVADAQYLELRILMSSMKALLGKYFRATPCYHPTISELSMTSIERLDDYDDTPASHDACLKTDDDFNLDTRYEFIRDEIKDRVEYPFINPRTGKRYVTYRPFIVGMDSYSRFAFGAEAADSEDNNSLSDSKNNVPDIGE